VMPSAATAPIYRALGFTVGELRHYVAARGRRPVESNDRLIGRPLLTADDFAGFSWSSDPSVAPIKTVEFFRRRYAQHPTYTYRVTGLFDGTVPAGILISRVARHDDVRAVRIVDFRGPTALVARIGSIVRQLIEDAGARHADVYNDGIDPALFLEAGFTEVDPDDSLIVPDHFEPYEHRNIRLWFAFKGQSAVIFKGDSDQDRPNIVAGSAG